MLVLFKLDFLGDEGHLEAGVSEPLVHLGELRVDAEVVNVLGVARHRHPLALQPGRIGIVGCDEPGVLTGQLPQLVLQLLLIALLDLGEDVAVNMSLFFLLLPS